MVQIQIKVVNFPSFTKGENSSVVLQLIMGISLGVLLKQMMKTILSLVNGGIVQTPVLLLTKVCLCFRVSVIYSTLVDRLNATGGFSSLFF